MTTEPESAENDTQNIEEIIKNYEEIYKSSQDELEFHKLQYLRLKNEVLKTVEENQRLNAEITKLKIFSEKEKETAEQLDGESLDLLKAQIEHLTDERDTFESLWKASQQTVESLEVEIQDYWSQLSHPGAVKEIEKKYNEAIESIKGEGRKLKVELDRQVEKNKEADQRRELVEQELKEVKTKTLEQQKLLSAYSNTEEVLSVCKKSLEAAIKRQSELEQSLQASQEIISEHLKREEAALDKIQEALSISENAVLEKDAAVERERTIREECDSLAVTIGEVMEEAAAKVEQRIEGLKMQHQEDLKEAEVIQKKLKALLESQVQKTKMAEKRCQAMEKMLKEMAQRNVTLDSDLQVASQAIIELELKQEAIERLLDYDQKTNKVSEDREKELQTFLVNNKQMKERWKNAVEDVTKKLQEEFAHLKNENALLLIENQELKAKISEKILLQEFNSK